MTTPATLAALRADLAAVECRIGRLELARAHAPRWQPWAGFVRAREMGRLGARARKLRYQIRCHAAQFAALIVEDGGQP